jgi:gas vesicle protein
MENLNNGSKIVGALLLGTAIGGVLGILFAPDKGSETRKKIVGKSEDLSEAIKDKFNEFVENFKDEVASVKERASDMVDNGMAKTKV